MLSSLLLSLSLFFSTAAGTPESGFERLKGFETVLVNQINNTIGSTRLPAAMGYPIEPGVYVMISMDAMTIFDRTATTLNAGVLANQVPAKRCRSGCTAVMFGAFRRTWLDLREESKSIEVDLPSRILFGTDAQLPAATLIDAAYAAAEGRPVQPPNLYLLLNANKAGLRARSFYLLPPDGLRREAGARLLGLKARIDLGGRFKMSAIDPHFPRNTSGTGIGELKTVLKDIKKRYPGKETLIIEAGPGTTMAEIVAVMATSQDLFPQVVLSVGK